MLKPESRENLGQAYTFVYKCNKCRQPYGSDKFEDKSMRQCPLCEDN